VAPQCVAMSAIWFPKGHHGGPKLVRFDILGLLCCPHSYEACIWEGQNSDFDDSCVVLTHFRVLKLRWFQAWKTYQLVHGALAREAS